MGNSITQSILEKKKMQKTNFEQNFNPKDYISVGVTE